MLTSFAILSRTPRITRQHERGTDVRHPYTHHARRRSSRGGHRLHRDADRLCRRSRRCHRRHRRRQLDGADVHDRRHQPRVLPDGGHARAGGRRLASRLQPGLVPRPLGRLLRRRRARARRLHGRQDHPRQGAGRQRGARRRAELRALEHRRPAGSRRFHRVRHHQVPGRALCAHPQRPRQLVAGGRRGRLRRRRPAHARRAARRHRGRHRRRRHRQAGHDRLRRLPHGHLRDGLHAADPRRPHGLIAGARAGLRLGLHGPRDRRRRPSASSRWPKARRRSRCRRST